jgi:hypothetical protein
MVIESALNALHAERERGFASELNSGRQSSNSVLESYRPKWNVSARPRREQSDTHRCAIGRDRNASRRADGNWLLYLRRQKANERQMVMHVPLGRGVSQSK